MYTWARCTSNDVCPWCYLIDWHMPWWFDEQLYKIDIEVIGIVWFGLFNNKEVQSSKIYAYENEDITKTMLKLGRTRYWMSITEEWLSFCHLDHIVIIVFGIWGENWENLESKWDIWINRKEVRIWKAELHEWLVSEESQGLKFG